VVQKIIVLISIQYFIFPFTIKDKSVRLLVRTRACIHLSIIVVKLTALITYGFTFIHKK